LEIDEPELPFQFDPSGWAELRGVIGKRFAERTRDEWAEIFADSDACVSPVLTPWEAHEHPHNVARQAFVEVDGLVQPAPAPRFSRTPAAAPRPVYDGGRDIAETLGDWGLAPGRIEELVAAGAVA